MSNSNLIYTTMATYDNMNDEELIKLVKIGDENALNFIIDRYKEMVNIKVSKYFIIGAEKEDIVQEGLIGLFKAVKGFDYQKENSFKTFANVCIERQLITAIKTSNRQKHMPLNSYLSLSSAAYSETESDNLLIDIFDSNTMEDPLDTVTKMEYYKIIEDAIDNSLSQFEKKVLCRFVRGESYIKIAEKLNTPVKSIDNAIQRIRKKAIKNVMEQTDEIL
ncbi:MAG TPA: RNA polymerase sporulation sigma factor SigH [Clostridia bacterium]|nr:RNA polymerase sporulation sigma factor SigH [Clostridia bacterium]